MNGIRRDTETLSVSMDRFHITALSIRASRRFYGLLLPVISKSPHMDPTYENNIYYASSHKYRVGQ